MDISRIRKKIKKSRAQGGEKVKKQSPAVNAEDAQGTVDVKPVQLDPKTEVGKEADVKKEDFRSESPGVDKEKDLPRVEKIEILAFKIANEEYAVKISELLEVLRNQRITPVPRSPQYLKGITSVRGKILPVINLKMRLGLKDDNLEKEKILVISGKKEPLGALVGKIMGVFKVPANEFLPPPSTLTNEERGFIEGVVKINSKFISILNVDEIYTMEGI